MRRSSCSIFVADDKSFWLFKNPYVPIWVIYCPVKGCKAIKPLFSGHGLILELEDALNLFMIITEEKNRLVNGASLFIIIALLTVLVYVGQEILFPIIMAFLIAILLRPVVSFLNNKMKFPHVMAVMTALLLTMLLTLGVFFFLGKQIMQFSDDIPRIKHNLYIHLHHVQQWVKDKLNVSYTKQQTYINETVSAEKVLDSSAIDTFTGTLLNLVLIPIYTFLILLYRTLFFNFFVKLIPAKHHAVLQEIMFEIKTVVRSYIVGLLFELIAVAVLTAIGLWIIGVDYFIFLGLMTAILNLIPYIGILVAGTVCIIVAMAGSTELGSVVGVIIVNVVVQFIDNNILVPQIIGSKISINALVSIVAVVIGGALAGIAGMFLALPIIAILKVIFDRIPPLKPWGYILGDNMPKTFHWRKIYLPDLSGATKKEND